VTTPPFRFLPIVCLGLLLGTLAGCDSKPSADPVIGHAFAGPASLNLHQEIDSKSPTVAIAHHGDALDIVAQRRRWYKVRSAKGVAGWVSDRELLDTAQMKRLRALAKETAGMPSQGAATTFGTLNVHSEPSRQSPSFVQVREHERVDVIAHKVTPRAAAAPKRELIPPRPALERRKAKEKPSKIPEPPTPAPPPLPSDWLELSKQGEPPPDPDDAAPPGPSDDWTLIRTDSGQSGWVLTSGLYMAIPDEVAQYAEGHRITSYFSLGKIPDGDLRKDIWLWTTSDTLGEDHDFDGYRVFVWSLRHHRYETAYIQRRERGFFPVLAKGGEFSVCLERADGSRVRKAYTMSGNAVRPVGDKPCEKTAEQEVTRQQLATSGTAGPAVKTSLMRRLKEKARGLFGK
jgi:hypothetical protein